MKDPDPKTWIEAARSYNRLRRLNMRFGLCSGGSFVVFVVLEHGEVHDPEQFVLGFVDELFAASDFQAHLPHRIARDIPFAANHQNRIANASARRLN